MPTEAEIAWAAGLFEGEGCLTVSSGKQKNGKVYQQAHVKVGSTDEDTIRRFHEIVGCGRFREETYWEKYGWKRQYHWSVSNKRDVRAVIEMLVPWFGARRTVRADELLALVNKD